MTKLAGSILCGLISLFTNTALSESHPYFGDSETLSVSLTFNEEETSVEDQQELAALDKVFQQLPSHVPACLTLTPSWLWRDAFILHIRKQSGENFQLLTDGNVVITTNDSGIFLENEVSKIQDSKAGKSLWKWAEKILATKAEADR